MQFGMLLFHNDYCEYPDGITAGSIDELLKMMKKDKNE